MVKPIQIKSRILLTVTFLLLLYSLLILIMLFVGEDKFKEILPQEIFFGVLRIFIIVFVYGLSAPWIINKIKIHVSEKYNAFRLTVEVLSIFIVAVLLAVFLYFIGPIRSGEFFQGSLNFMIKAPLFCFVLGGIIFSIYEAWMNFVISNELRDSMVKLEKEQLSLKLNVLQHKMDPHFMFNSLNVLSELVHQDSDKADKFISQFAKLYRYVLDINAESLVTLAKEMEVLDAYFYLLQIRMADTLIIEDSINEDKEGFLLPPLSLQLIVENAIKHNAATKSNPLTIKLFNENGNIVVSNNINKRMSSTLPSGFGLEKLKKSYELLNQKLPEIHIEKALYTVKLPLLKNPK